MYYMFGFIMLAFIVLVVVCAQTSILLCYFHLCSEDYRWWWRAFFSTGECVYTHLCLMVICALPLQELLLSTSSCFQSTTSSTRHPSLVPSPTSSTLAIHSLWSSSSLYSLVWAPLSLLSLSLLITPICFPLGTIGFVACLLFVRKIYSIVKID